jgi:hypothetical protein
VEGQGKDPTGSAQGKAPGDPRGEGQGLKFSPPKKAEDTPESPSG